MRSCLPMRFICRRMVCRIVPIAAVLAGLSGAARAEAPAWWKAEEPAQPSALACVLGPDLAAWSLATTHGAPVRARLTEADGRIVLASTNVPWRLAGLTRYGSNVEIRAVFRLAPPEKAAASLALTAALPDPGDPAGRGQRFSVSLGADHAAMNLNVTDPAPPDTNRPYVSLSYQPRSRQPQMLSWPDWVRRLVEHELASLPAATDKWLTLRYQLRGQSVRAYLNDRLVLERAPAGLDVTGFLRVELSPHAQLASLQVRPLDPPDPVFEPIALEGYANAALMNGRRVDRTRLPPAEVSGSIRGIPFVFPGPDSRGNDHLDVGPSWLQTGCLEGAFYPHGGGMEARWIGAFQENPARLCFSVPRARYSALHLVAAADDDPDSVPVVTALFYRPSAGHPVAFDARVPLFSARSTAAMALPVALENGKPGNLYLVTIPLDPDQLGLFDDQDTLQFELTKEVQLYRAYPDPMFYSRHGAGLPSSVQVYAMTFEQPAVTVAFEPDAYAHVWVAPAKPRYTVSLRNRAAAPRAVDLSLSCAGPDGIVTAAPPARVSVPAGKDGAASFTLSPARYGLHTATLTVADAGRTNRYARNLAYLHPDTRERGNWQPGQGPCFGFWNWRGGHDTPPSARQMAVMGLAGGESEIGSLDKAGEEEKKIAEQFGMVTYKAFGAGDHWVTGALVGDLAAMPEQAALTNMLAKLLAAESKPGPIHKPTYISFFPEPGIGAWHGGNWPDYWGEAPYPLTEADEKRYQAYERAFILGATEVKKRWPDIKRLMPHGDPVFPLLFLRRSAAVRGLIDGMAVDIAGFERLPEQQLHQVSMHRLYICRQEFLKAGLTNPVLPNYEGPIVPTKPGAVPPDQAADLNVRNALIQLAYGVNPLLGSWPMAECANYWGEQHYGAGLCHRLPRVMPERSYVAVATLTRHLNRRNFTRWLPTGSLSVYALQFRHFKTGEPVHVLWTVRGRRPVSLHAAPGAAVRVFDQMDNETVVKETNGTATITVTPSPCFVYGFTNDLVVASLGEPDHSDAAPAPGAVKLGNLGNGKWKISNDEDPAYASNHYFHVRRTPTPMSALVETAPAAQGGQALAVRLDPPAVERKVMPFYTTLVPDRPVGIPGKPARLGLWVRAASDWGRVVYCLRDTRGERWISVGKKNDWNGDDVHSWSYFCFDGWRYLAFELPGNSPWDAYRENGSSWWGAVPPGDGIVDLPLTLEKIIVERRTHAMYVNDPQPARSDNVLFGDLYAEYARSEDATAEAVRLSRLRMPLPKDAPELGNPMAEFAAAGVGQAPRVTRVEPPAHEFDGTRCHVFFDPVPGAKIYDIWVSPYPDGRGAVQLGKDWTEPGKLIRGLRPDTDFYVFVLYVDQSGQRSKPSNPFKINLQPLFGFK